MSRCEMVVLLAVLSFFVMGAIGTTEGADIRVDWRGGRDHTTITEAVNASSAGDRIFVYQGTYFENFTINKSIDLMAMPDEIVIVDALKMANVTRILADDVTIEGITFKNSTKTSEHIYAAIRVDGRSGITIRDCTLEDSRYGIYLKQGSSNILIENCDFVDINYYGVYALSSNDITIKDCNAYSPNKEISRGGYLIENTNDASVIGCEASEIQRGVYIRRSWNIDVELNASFIGIFGVGVQYGASRDIDIIARVKDTSADGIYIFDKANNVTVHDSDIRTTTSAVKCSRNATDIWINSSYVSVSNVGGGKGTAFDLSSVKRIFISDMVIENVSQPFSLIFDARAHAKDSRIIGGGNTASGFDARTTDSVLILEGLTYEEESKARFFAEGEGWISQRQYMDVLVLDSQKNAAFAAEIYVNATPDAKEGVLYSTTGYGGSDPKTGNDGLVTGISAPYLFMNRVRKTWNWTTVTAEYDTWEGSSVMNTSRNGVHKVFANDPLELDPTVTPDKVRSGWMVVFNCTYIDPDNVNPSMAVINLNGTDHNLTKGEGAPVVGTRFYYETWLDRGNYTYQYFFNDTVYEDETEERVIQVLNDKPRADFNNQNLDEKNDRPLFTFYTNYTDHDNDAPMKVKLVIYDTDLSTEMFNVSMHPWDKNATDYISGVLYNVSIPLENGLKNYRFNMHDGREWNLSEWNAEEINEPRPVLSSPFVTPITGNATTLFQFRVTYSHSNSADPEGKTGGVPKVFINDIVHDLEPDPNDDDPIFQGKDYILEFTGLSRGIYNVSFYASDGLFETRTENITLNLTNTAPSFEFSYLPEEGHASVLYTLYVTYYDLDNDLPEDLVLIVDHQREFSIHGSGVNRLFAVVDNDTVTEDGKLYQTDGNFLHGKHHVVVRAIDEEGGTNWTRKVYPDKFFVNLRPNAFTLLERQGDTEIDPITFYLNYSDLDSDPASLVNITFVKQGDPTIQFTPYAMEEPRQGSPIKGMSYTLEMTFSTDNHPDMGTGNYYYWIDISDGYSNRTIPGENFYVFPADIPPVLDDPTFVPTVVTVGDQVTFSVQYSDADGDAPVSIDVQYGEIGDDKIIWPMEKIGFSDDFVGGVYYQVTVTVSFPGDYLVTYIATSGQYLEKSTGATSMNTHLVVKDVPEDGGGEEADYTIVWVILIIIIFVGAGAFAGLMARKQRKREEAAYMAKRKEDEEKKQRAANKKKTGEGIEWSFDDDEDIDFDDDDDLDFDDEEDIEWE